MLERMCILRWLFLAAMVAILTAAQGGEAERKAPPPTASASAERR